MTTTFTKTYKTEAAAKCQASKLTKKTGVQHVTQSPAIGQWQVACFPVFRTAPRVADAVDEVEIAMQKTADLVKEVAADKKADEVETRTATFLRDTGHYIVATVSTSQTKPAIELWLSKKLFDFATISGPYEPGSPISVTAPASHFKKWDAKIAG